MGYEYRPDLLADVRDLFPAKPLKTSAFIDSDGRLCNACGNMCVEGQRWRDDNEVRYHICTGCFGRDTFIVHDIPPLHLKCIEHRGDS